MNEQDRMRVLGTAAEWRALIVKAQDPRWRRLFYHAYIKSRAWKVKGAEIHERSGGCCERCGSPGAENVHHRTYAHLGDERPEELADLCRKCHQIVHSRRPQEGREEGLPPAVADIVTDLACRGYLGANPPKVTA